MNTRVSSAAAKGRQAFTLLEMTFVIIIMMMLLALLLPAFGGFFSVAGRRAAVNIVMSAFDRARAAALESGQNAHVGFADGDFPVADMRFAAFIVFRDATDAEKTDPINPRDYVVLQKWTRLPKTIAFKNTGSSLVGTNALVKTFPGLGSQVGTGQADETFPVVAFNFTGAVDEPVGNILRLFLYEGYFASGADNHTRNKAIQETAAGLFEKISLSRYTGRAQLDITATGP